MRNFRTLEIWKQGIEIVKQIYRLSEALPKEERYGLRSQITRAAISVPSNIAEGCSRNSDTDFKRFLKIAVGSLFELETQLIIIEELILVDHLQIGPLKEMIIQEQKMINKLINTIK